MVFKLKKVSIPYEREGAFRLTLFSTQTGRGSGYPKTKHELREAFFRQKFIPKIPQTLVNTDPNAIFQQNRYGSQSSSMFLNALSHTDVRVANRVCFYKYTQNLHISQIFLRFFVKIRLLLLQKYLTHSLKINKIGCEEVSIINPSCYL